MGLKAPFGYSKGPDLTNSAENLVASQLSSITWAGITSDESAIVAGGATIDSANRLRGVNDESGDNYVDNVASFQVDWATGDLVESTAPSLSDSREYMVAAQVMNCILLAGGLDEKGSSDIVEMVTSFGEHEVLTPLAYARNDFAAASVNDNALFAGGCNSTMIEVYGSNFQKRYVSLGIDKPVRGLCSVHFNGYAVFAGGRTYDNKLSKRVVAVDGNMNMKTNIPDLSVARYNLSAAVAINPTNPSEQYLFIAGGKSSHTGFETVIDIYDTDFNLIDHSLSLSQGRSRMAAASIGGYVLFGGGVSGVEPADVPSAVVDVFDFKLRAFDQMALSVARNSLSAAAVGDSVIFAGGYAGSSGTSKVVDRFFLGSSPAPGTNNVTFAWSVNSDVTDLPLPNSISWPVGTKIYPANLPPLPSPTDTSETITGWYIDRTASTLLDSNGIMVSSEGLTLYVKGMSANIFSLNYDYAKGRVHTVDSLESANNTFKALDRDVLGDYDVLPSAPTIGTSGQIIVLPTAAQMLSVFPGTAEEMVFQGWYSDPQPTSGVQAITQVVLAKDTTVYALYEPKVTEPGLIAVTYKLGQPFEPMPEPQANGKPRVNTGAYGGFMDFLARIMPKVKTGIKIAKDVMQVIPWQNIFGDEVVNDVRLRDGDIDITDVEWTDFAKEGDPYTFKPPTPQLDPTGENIFVTYYKDFECTIPCDSISALSEDTVVYCKFAKKPEVVLEPDPDLEVPETYNISFLFDGLEEATADNPDAGLMPPDCVLPETVWVEPEIVEDEPTIVDEYDFPAPQNHDGYEFEYYYSYDDNGDKVVYDPTEPITHDLVLYPKFEFIGEQIETKVPVTFMIMDPDTTDTKIDDWAEVPLAPFKGMVNPFFVNRKETFVPANVTIPNMPAGYSIDKFYLMIPSTSTGTYVMQEIPPTGIPASSMDTAITVWCEFKNAMPEMPAIVYHSISTPGSAITPVELEAITPIFDADLAPPVDAYQGQPADISSLDMFESDPNIAIEGLYVDALCTKEFEPDTLTKNIDIYQKVEISEATHHLVTIGYFPQDLTTGTGFEFQIPTNAALPAKIGEGLSFNFPTGETGTNILNILGEPPGCFEWEPKNSEGLNNSYWIEKTIPLEGSLTSGKTLVPFDPEGYSLLSDITLYPQFEPNLSWNPEPELELSRVVASDLSYAVGDGTLFNV